MRVNSRAGMNSREAAARVLRSFWKPSERAKNTLTVELGLVDEHVLYFLALKDAGYDMREKEREVLNGIPLSSKKTVQTLTAVSVASLGFRDCARYDEICHRGIASGRELCTGECSLSSACISSDTFGTPHN